MFVSSVEPAKQQKNDDDYDDKAQTISGPRPPVGAVVECANHCQNQDD
jgi:hypothetical protein